MKGNVRLSPAALLAVMLAASLTGLSRPAAAAPAAGAISAAAQPQPDSEATQAAEARLNKSQFKEVKVSVDNGIATLTGTVSLYEYKADAEKRVHRAKGVAAVRNLIQVNGTNVPDPELQAKLAEKLTYDRVGFGNAFNAISVQVQDGVVTLGGHARTYVDRDSALALANTTPGVKDVVNDIEVDPVSTMDDQIRFQVARAIYNYPTLNKYALNPARPIRISVQNGHVELYGIVDSQPDKETAYIRASGVPNVFSVTNYLQVAGQPTESPK